MVGVYSDLLVVSVIGKLVMFTIQKLYQDVSWIKKALVRLDKLIGCGYCLGFWVYMGVSYTAGLNLYSFPVLLSLPLTALSISFVVWVFSAGWRTLFGVYSI